MISKNMDRKRKARASMFNNFLSYPISRATINKKVGRRRLVFTFDPNEVRRVKARACSFWLKFLTRCCRIRKEKEEIKTGIK